MAARPNQQERRSGLIMLSVFTLLVPVVAVLGAFIYGIVQTLRFRADNPGAPINRGRVLCLAAIPFMVPRMVVPMLAMFYKFPPRLIVLLPLSSRAYVIGLTIVAVAIPFAIVDEIRRRKRLAVLKAQLGSTSVDSDAWPPPPKQ